MIGRGGTPPEREREKDVERERYIDREREETRVGDREG